VASDYVFEVVVAIVIGAGALTSFYIWQYVGLSRRLTEYYGAELAKRDARIAQLERDLEVAHRQIETLMLLIESLTGITDRDVEAMINGDRELLNALSTRFSRDELDMLAAEIGVDHENLSGDTVRARALSLYVAARHRGKIRALRAAIKKERGD
jgi:hypothetical protein